MTGMGVHLTDLLISMLGPVEAVAAQTACRVLELPTGDIVTVQLKFQSGATGFVGAISSTPYYGRFTIFGDQMWVEARDDSHPQHGGKAHLITCGKDGVQHSQTFAAKDSVRANLEEWADAVLNGAAYRFTDEQRIGNVAVLEAIVKSAESGSWVRV
jgi:predicted dehydrogenase